MSGNAHAILICVGLEWITSNFRLLGWPTLVFWHGGCIVLTEDFLPHKGSIFNFICINIVSVLFELYHTINVFQYVEVCDRPKTYCTNTCLTILWCYTVDTGTLKFNKVMAWDPPVKEVGLYQRRTGGAFPSACTHCQLYLQQVISWRMECSAQYENNYLPIG